MPDMVIGAPGDCSGSATWLITDQLNMEKLGIPTITVITSPFSEIAASVTRAEGFSSACIVPIAPPLGMLTRQEVEEKANQAFGEIVKATPYWHPTESVHAEGAAYPAAVLDFKGTIEDLNDHFMEKQWSLGLPVLPPTPERVGEMLKGTARNPGEVLGQVPPNSGDFYC